MTYTNGTYQWVSVPKTATRAISAHLRRNGWRPVGDHRPYAREAGGVCVAAIRCPYSRLASSASFLGIANIGLLEKTIAHYEQWRGVFPANRFFVSQVEFVDLKGKLFRYENLPDMLRLIGVENLPKRNRHPHQLSASVIQENMSDLVERLYRDDMQLRETL